MVIRVANSPPYYTVYIFHLVNHGKPFPASQIHLRIAFSGLEEGPVQLQYSEATSKGYLLYLCVVSESVCTRLGTVFSGDERRPSALRCCSRRQHCTRTWGPRSKGRERRCNMGRRRIRPRTRMYRPVASFVHSTCLCST